MHRRGVGAGAIAKKKLAEAKYKERGTVLAEDQLAQMSKQLDMFKSNLEEFASKHKQEIRKNPEFRVQFQDMCATIGVDPLASGKGFWSEMLGVGDFYYELGVQIIEVCLALKHRNGGLITLEELRQQVLKGRGKFAQDVSHLSSLLSGCPRPPGRAEPASRPALVRPRPLSSSSSPQRRPAQGHQETEGARQRLRHHPRGRHLPHSVCAGGAQHGSHGGAAAGREKWLCDCQ
ncbi:vacuolar-sorting protein SNF8 isoform X2 [Ailuropoda melanoleuca]|uniref:vacuolar-sorting protein SNF8 isoform X2 n=1 Tax=Ailuropoda melanoleuca TaxID=9646 RepID=UPI00149426CB|nr:vacuolar-sorting protein SNF8 isoform X2 [Ailuropoda melanoleuca]